MTAANETVWRLVETDAQRTEEPTPTDMIGFALMSEGALFTVHVSGAKGMTLTQTINAMRAALWYALKAGNASPAELDALKVRIPDAGELTCPGKPS